MCEIAAVFRRCDLGQVFDRRDESVGSGRGERIRLALRVGNFGVRQRRVWLTIVSEHVCGQAVTSGVMPV